MSETDVDLELGEEESGGGKMMMIIIVVAVLLVGGGAAMFFMGLGPFGSDEEVTTETGDGTEGEVTEAENTEPLGPIIYHEMDDLLVINLKAQGTQRYLQLSIQFATRSDDVIDALSHHMPVIRNNIYLMMGEKSKSDLETIQQKEQIRKDILLEVQKILADRDVKDVLEDLYFDDFVIQ